MSAFIKNDIRILAACVLLYAVSAVVVAVGFAALMDVAATEHAVEMARPAGMVLAEVEKSR